MRQPEDDAPRLSLPLGKGMPQRPTWQELTRHLVFVEHVRVSTLRLSPGHDDESDPPVNKIEARAKKLQCETKQKEDGR